MLLRVSLRRCLTLLAALTSTLALATAVTAPASAAPAITPGRSITVSVTGAERTWSFDARAGDRAVLSVNASALTGESRSVGFFLRRGGTEVTLGGTASAPDFLDDAAPLTRGGSWTLAMRGHEDTGGTITFTLRLVRDAAASATAGSPQTVRYTTPGAAVRLGFTGSRGQVMVLDLSAQNLIASVGPSTVTATLLRPDGSEATAYGTVEPQRWDEFVLDTGGRWTLVLDPAKDTTGTQTLAVRLPAPIRANTAQGRVHAQVTEPGRYVQLSTQATRGRPLAAEVLGADWTSTRWPDLAGAAIDVFAPDGSFFSTLVPTGDRYGVTPVLPTSGRYTVRIDPALDTVGRVELVLDQGTTTTTAGLPSDSAVDLGPADVRRFRFTGTAGRPLGITLAGATWRSTGDRLVDVSLRRPDGTVLQSWPELSSIPAYLESPELDSGGTWTLVIASARASSGVLRVTASQPTITTGPVAPGTATQVAVATPGGRARLTFSAEAGQRVALDRTSVQWRTADRQPAAAAATLIRPDGTPLGDFTGTTAPGWGGTYPLDATGIWTIEFAPENGAIGTETVVLDRWTPDPPAGFSLGQTAPFATPQRGHYAEFAFTMEGPSRDVPWSVSAPGLRRVVLRVVLPTGQTRTVTALPELGITSGTLHLTSLSGGYRLIIDTSDSIGAGTVTLGW